MTIIALVAIIAFPLITVTFRQVYPLVDTWVMPAMLIVLVDASAIMNILAVWRGLEHCVISILALILSMQAALCVTTMLISEAIVP
jgi:hypothetical protein